MLSGQAASQLCFMFAGSHGNLVSPDSTRAVPPSPTPMSNHLLTQYPAYILIQLSQLGGEAAQTSFLLVSKDRRDQIILNCKGNSVYKERNYWLVLTRTLLAGFDAPIDRSTNHRQRLFSFASDARLRLEFSGRHGPTELLCVGLCVRGYLNAALMYIAAETSSPCQ